MRRAAVVVLLVLLVIAACGDDGEDVDAGDGGDGGGTTGPLTGRTFVGGDGLDLVEGTELRLSFTAEQMTAQAGCNTLSGAYATAGGDRISVQGLAGTEMGCEPELMDQDTRLADLFAAPVTVDLDGPTLTLTFSDGAAATLTDEEVATPDLALAGTRWVLDTLIDGDAASSVPAGVAATIAFADDGTYQVAAGCNGGPGTYTERDGSLVLDPPTITRRRCEEPTMQVENAVLTVIDGEVSVSIDGERMTLTAADGTGLGFTTE